MSKAWLWMPLDLCCDLNTILNSSNVNDVSLNSSLAEVRTEESMYHPCSRVVTVNWFSSINTPVLQCVPYALSSPESFLYANDIITVTLVTFTIVFIFMKSKSWEKIELPHCSSTLKYFLYLYLSYINPISCCWPCLLWFVQQIVATCCFVHLYMCIYVFVSMCTLLSSKLGDKGGVESLMSCLTGCIHVSLFLPANTCCSVWERHCDATHTLIGGKKERKRESKVFFFFFVKLEETCLEDIIPWLPSRERSPYSHRKSMNFEMLYLHWVFEQINRKEVKRASLTGESEWSRVVQQSFRANSNKLKSVSALKSVWKFVLLCKMVRPVLGVTCYKMQHHYSQITFACNRVMVLFQNSAVPLCQMYLLMHDCATTAWPLICWYS